MIGNGVDGRKVVIQRVMSRSPRSPMCRCAGGEQQRRQPAGADGRPRRALQHSAPTVH